MNNLITNEELSRQIQLERSRENALHRERSEELAHLYLISTMNKGDIFTSKHSKKLGRSLMAQVNSFYKSMTEEGRTANFRLIAIINTEGDFLEYLSGNISKDKILDYEEALQNEGFRYDVRNALRQKCFEHKALLEERGSSDGFQSIEAKSKFAQLLLVRNMRKSAHEAVNGAIKHHIESGLIADDDKKALLESIENMILNNVFGLSREDIKKLN